MRAPAAIAAAALVASPAPGRGQPLRANESGDIPAEFLAGGVARWRGTLYDNRRALEKVVTLEIEPGSISSAENPVQVASLDMACPAFRSWRRSSLHLAWVDDTTDAIGLHEFASSASPCRGIGDSCCQPTPLLFAVQVVDPSTLRVTSVEGPSMGWLTRETA